MIKHIIYAQFAFFFVFGVCSGNAFNTVSEQRKEIIEMNYRLSLLESASIEQLGEIRVAIR